LCPTVSLPLTFIGSCIVIYLYSKTNQMHHFLKFYFGITLYMFWTVFLHVLDGLFIHNHSPFLSKALYSFCDYRMQFCRVELKDLPRPKGSPLFIALKVISLYLT
jgi:hypothetical protein